MYRYYNDISLNWQPSVPSNRRGQTGPVTTLGLLHTAASHRAGFEALVAGTDPTIRTVTVVDESLLGSARRAGPTDPQVADAIRQRLRELAGDGADAIICTCSTIGGVAEVVGGELGLDVVRVDRAMAERAVAIGGRVSVLAALGSTVAPTGDLIAEVAARQGASVAVVATVVEGAWERFEAGDIEGYHALVAHAIERVGDDADVIVLAQASMAAAAERVTAAVPVLSSPRSAVTSALRRR